MFVSVIIPNYNHEQFLVKRIESVLNQTYGDFEVIILDDCSTDNSLSIIDRYATHPKISSVIRNEKNSGSPFAQWRKGIGEAKGEFIWLAESDDYANESFLEIMVAQFQRYSSACMAYCESNVIDETNKILYPCAATLYAKYDDQKWLKDYYNNGIEEIREILFRENIISNASSVLFRKAVWDNVDTMDLMYMRYAGDWLLWVRMLQQGDIAYVAKPLNYFRTHAATTRSAPKDIYKIIFLVNEMNKVLTDIAPYVKPEDVRAKFLENLSVFAANLKYGELPKLRGLISQIDSLPFYSRKYMFYYVLNKRLRMILGAIKNRIKKKSNGDR